MIKKDYLLWLALACLSLQGCTSTPIFDRNPTIRNPATPVVPDTNNSPTPNTSTSGTANTGQPTVASKSPTVDPLPCNNDPSTPAGFYRVRPKENLFRIALCNGKHYGDLARWNGLSDPNQIQAGQLLRITPPTGETTSVTGVKPMTSGVPADKVTMTKLTNNQPSFAWPYKGSIINRFAPPKSKGLDIGGVENDTIFAAADGKVVYSGNELKGLTNLIIIKHNDIFVTAYANNSAILVKEDQMVSQGQAIAKMGKTPEDGKPMLHFEIRKNGIPVDPESLLQSQP